MKYKDIFFDLDNTLWDFDYNSKIVLNSIYDKFDLKKYGVVSKKKFIDVYKNINAKLWYKYREGIITKDVLRQQRFFKTLIFFNIENRNLSDKIGNFYIVNSPSQTKLFGGAKDVLFNLSLYYNLHIMLHHITLRYIILYCIVSYYITLYFTV